MSTAATAQHIDPSATNAHEREPALPLRSDTLLGVCEAIGQDLGFNPTWLRAAFAGLFLWNPEVVVACYLGLGIVVALTRWAFPVTSKAAKAPAQPAPANEAVAEGELAKEKELLAA
jgi:phage shock protein C